MSVRVPGLISHCPETLEGAILASQSLGIRGMSVEPGRSAQEAGGGDGNMTIGQVNFVLSGALLACVFFVTGCNQRVAIVNYTQVGACNYGTHKAAVFFEIGEIDNTGPTPDFNFVPIRVTLEEGMEDQAPWPHYLRLLTEYLVSESKVVPLHVLVPHGTSKSLLKFMVFRRQTADPHGSTEANQTPYFLRG